MELPGFIGASYRSTAQEVDVEDLVNMYPEFTSSPGAKSRIALYGSPGLNIHHDYGTGPIRGQYDLGGVTFTAAGGALWVELDNPGFSDDFELCDQGSISGGEIGNDGLPVRFTSDSTKVLLISAGNVFVVSNMRSLDAVPSPPWTRAIDCAYLDGYFIVLDDDGSPAGGKIFITTDPLTWDPLDFSTAPASNNKLTALAVDHEELWIFGTLITQPFYNNQNPDFPFVPNLTGVVMQGTQARDSVCQLDNTLFWVGWNKDGELEAYNAEGYTAKSITPPEIVQQWQSYMALGDLNIVSWTYQIGGHPTYHLNFLTAKKSWRYDRRTNLWHRVAYRNPVTNMDECHRGNSHVVRKGVHLVGDRENGIVYEFSPTFYRDYHDPMVSIRRSPAQNQENKIIFYPIFELITPGGIGDGSDAQPETDPAWMLSWSNDNGHTFGPEFQLHAGRQGAYGTRVRKNGCGSGRNRVWQVSISANVPRCLIGAEIPGAYVGIS